MGAANVTALTNPPSSSPARWNNLFDGEGRNINQVATWSQEAGQAA